MPSEKTVAQKLQIKPGRTLLIANPPADAAALLRDMPDGVELLATLSQPALIILLFAANRAELEAHLPGLMLSLAPGGMIWVLYTKGTSRLKTDIHRDSINAYAHAIGLEGVSMVSINEDWSALRLKRIA